MAWSSTNITWWSIVSNSWRNFKGRKVVILGIGCFEFEDSLIKNYIEAVNGGLTMVQLGVNPLRMEKVFLKWLKRSFINYPNLLEIK